jgi:hypothetical protein
VLDHPAGGIGVGGQGLLVAFLGQQGGLQFDEGIGAGVVVIGLQLLGEQTDGGGELLGLDAQLPEGADRTGGSVRSRNECRRGSREESDGNGEQKEGRRSGGEGLRRKGRRDLHHRDRHRRTGGRAAGLLHQRGGAGPTGEGDHQH